MSRELLNTGDRLIWLQVGGTDGAFYKAGANKVISIGVNQLPGPMGFYLVANIVSDEGPDVIVPLHMTDGFAVSNP